MDIKDDLIRHYQWLRRYGLNDSHSGNASVRDGDTIWITPTGCCADTLTVDELIPLRLDAPPTPGASLDAPLHLAVYLANPDAQAIIHSHGPYSIAMTMDGHDFLPPDFEGQYYFKRIPVITIPYERYTDVSPRRVAEALRQDPVAVVCGHGVYACAENLNRAYKWSSSFESSAKTTWLARLAGTLPHVPGTS